MCAIVLTPVAGVTGHKVVVTTGAVDLIQPYWKAVAWATQAFSAL